MRAAGQHGKLFAIEVASPVSRFWIPVVCFIAMYVETTRVQARMDHYVQYLDHMPGATAIRSIEVRVQTALNVWSNSDNAPFTG